MNRRRPKPSARARQNSDRERRYTLAGSSVLSLLKYGDAQRLNLRPLEKSLGLDRALLAAPDTRVSQPVAHQVWETLSSMLSAQHLGLDVLEHFDLGSLDVLGHLAVHSKDVRELLDRVVRYNRILHDAGRVEYEVEGSALRVYPGCRGLLHPVPRTLAEYMAGLVLCVSRYATRRPIVVRAVAFRHGPPASLQRLRAFFGVTPTFNALETVVTLDAETLDWAVADNHTDVVTYLDRYAQHALAALPPSDGDLECEVRRLLAKGFEQGAGSQATIAKQLAMHPRTLQRRLSAQGVSFVRLLDETRKSLAERLLADGRLAIGEVAFMLGYAETSAFHRAFKRWTGRTPRTTRVGRRWSGVSGA